MSNIVPAENEKLPALANTSFDKEALHEWSDDLDTDRSKMLKKASIGLLLIFGFGGIWSCTAPLGGAVIAGGKVIAEDRNRPIQHLEGGILETMNVREGDKVNEGDVLLTLDMTKTGASLESYRLKKAIARLELARYRAEVLEQDHVAFPTDIDEAVAQHPRVVEALNSQREAFQTGWKDRQANKQNLNTVIKGLNGDIEGHKEVLIAEHRQLELFEEELVGFKELEELGWTSKIRVNATERKVVELKAAIARRNLAIEKANNDISIRESEKEQRRFRFLAQSNERLVATQKALNEAESGVAQLSDTVKRSVVRSPVTGTVFRLAKRSVGEVVKPGDTVMIIFPEEDALTIEAQLQATDRDEVFLGQDVEVVFPSDKENQGQPVDGKLTYISADTITSEANPIGTYVVKITVSPEASPEQFMPGNIADVYIQTEPKTFIEIISEPFTRFAFKAFKG